MSSYLVSPFNIINARGDAIVANQPYAPPSLTGAGGSLNIPGMALIDIRTAEAVFFDTGFPMTFSLLQNQAAIQANTYVMLVLGRNLHAVSVSGTFVATVLIEGSIDGNNWVTLSSVTTPGITQYSGLYMAIRVSVPAFTSGSVSISGITQRC